MKVIAHQAEQKHADDGSGRNMIGRNFEGRDGLGPNPGGKGK
jgi:hypothetical protein